MISISLCMIVRDEEQVLGRCLESIKDFIDEIIIVDTGSVDRTKEIARLYTSKVFDYKWAEDFASARNFACSKATMDYWMWLDADDVITQENMEKLRLLKESLKPNTDIVMMKYITGFDKDGNAVFSYYRERLIKNNKAFRWEGRVHETVTPSGVIMYSDAEIEHRKLKASDPDRNLNIYEKMISAGEELGTRHLFYYGRELYYHGRYSEAADVFNEFLKEPAGWVENKIDACLQRCRCYVYMKDYDSGLDSLFESFLYDVPRAEICCEIGSLFMERGALEKAIYWYEKALCAPDRSKAGAFTEEDCRGYIPYMQLCVCYDSMGNHEKAWEYHLRAAVLKPYTKEVAFNQNYFESIFSKEKM